MSPSIEDIDEGDGISVNTGPLSAARFHVSDIQVEDIGLTKTFAVTLASGSESYHSAYVMMGTTSSDGVTFSRVGDDWETTVEKTDVVLHQ